MRTRRWFTAAAVLSVAAAAPTAAVQTRAQLDDNEIQLTGCVVRDEGGDGFLVTNVPGQPAWQTVESRTSVTPGPVGTSGTSATVFYWLDDDDELEEHVGHKVQIRGELEGDVEAGEIKIDRKDNWTEMEIESDGRDLKVRVPQSLFVVSEAGRETDGKIDVLVRKVDAKDIRMLEATCDR